MQDKAFGKLPIRRRLADREAVLMPSVFTVLATSRTAILEDVSLTGGRLRASDLPCSGAEVLLRIGSVLRLAKIIWCHNGECGVVFDQPISEQDVEKLRREDASASLAHLTEEERLAAQEWLCGFAR